MADGLPRAHVAHRIPHRLRVHVPSRKGDQAYFKKAMQRLGDEPSVRSVHVSPRTGSITIEHDGHAQDIARLAGSHDLFDLPEAEVVYMVAESFAGRTASIDPPSVVSAGLAGIGVYQLIRGH